MKLICIIIVCFLLQSCYSYKPLKENEPLKVAELYKLRNIEDSNDVQILRLKSISDSSYIFENHRVKTFELSKEELEDGKMRKFSVMKTVGLTIGILGVFSVGIAIIAIISLGR